MSNQVAAVSAWPASREECRKLLYVSSWVSAVRQLGNTVLLQLVKEAEWTEGEISKWLLKMNLQNEEKEFKNQAVPMVTVTYNRNDGKSQGVHEFLPYCTLAEVRAHFQNPYTILHCMDRTKGNSFWARDRHFELAPKLKYTLVNMTAHTAFNEWCLHCLV